jgi:hypothetical protein
LESRALDQKWFELQQAQTGYETYFNNPKIVFRDISDRPTFSLDRTGFYIDMTCFCLPSDDLALLALLNAKASWFFWKNLTPELRGGFVRLKRQFVTQLPIPIMAFGERNKLSKFASKCSDFAAQRQEVQTTVRHRLLDFTTTHAIKFSRKLENWWTLDFAEFRDEVKRVFRTEIPVKERGQWESYLAEQGEKVRKLTTEIENAEREIDAIVYRLFDLTGEEIALLEASIKGQY